MKMIKVLGLARDTVKNPILRFVIVILSVATVCSIYFRTQKAEVPSSENTIVQVHNPDIRGATGFAWIRNWDDLGLLLIFNRGVPVIIEGIRHIQTAYTTAILKTPYQD